jgi:hypothetical protein
VDSITTRVTPRPYSQSASSSGDLSWWRSNAPLGGAGPAWSRAAPAHTPPASPCRYPARPPAPPARWLLCDLLHGDRPFGVDRIPKAGRPQEPTGTQRGGIACSTATMQDPWQRLPAPDTVTGSKHHSGSTSASDPPQFFTPAGRHRRDTHDTVASGDHPYWRPAVLRSSKLRQEKRARQQAD